MNKGRQSNQTGGLRQRADHYIVGLPTAGNQGSESMDGLNGGTGQPRCLLGQADLCYDSNSNSQANPGWGNQSDRTKSFPGASHTALK